MSTLERFGEYTKPEEISLILLTLVSNNTTGITSIVATDRE